MYLLRERHLNHQRCSFLKTSSQGTEITEKKKTLTQENLNLCLIVMSSKTVKHW